MTPTAKHYVEIVDANTSTIIRRMGPHTEAMAESVCDGASINLNHEKYFVRIVEKNQVDL